MKEFDLSTKKLKIKFDGEEAVIRKPSHREALALGEKLSKVEIGKQADLIEEELEKLGLPKTITSKLDSESIKVLMEELTGLKKS